MCLPAGSTFKHHALICLIRDSEQSTKVYFDVILCVCNLKNVTNVIKRRRKRLPFISYSVQRMPFGQSSLLVHRFLLEDTRKRVFRCTKKKGAYCWRMPVGRYSGQGCERGRPCECTPANQPRPNIGPCHRCFQDAQEYTLHPQPWPLPVPAIHLPTTNTSKCSNFNCKDDYETPSDEWLTAHTCLGSPARGKSAHFEGRKVERLLFACVLLCWDRK